MAASGFFAFANEPPELIATILAATTLIKPNRNMVIQAWPQSTDFGAPIPDKVRIDIDNAAVLIMRHH